MPFLGDSAGSIGPQGPAGDDGVDGSTPPDAVIRTVIEFTETPGAGVYTAVLDLPPGAELFYYPFQPFIVYSVWTLAAATLSIQDGDGDEINQGIPAEVWGNLGPLGTFPSSIPAYFYNNDDQSKANGVYYPDGTTLTIRLTTDDGGSGGFARLCIIGVGLPGGTIPAVRS